jgi:hypothetical protein
MATANTALRVTELDFDSIKNNLKTYLRNQPQFQDYNFDGSGMSVLLDVLAYNTHYMGYYLNMVANEMFLDTAQLRNSILSHAKNLNYTPQSAHGAKIQANVLVTPATNEDQNTNVITIDRYTKFLARDIDGVNYQFVSLYSNTVPKVGGTFSFSNINLQQGEVLTQQFLMDSATNPSRRFDLPSANIDTDTLTVTVQASSTNTASEIYNLADDITTIAGNSAVYFIEENPNLNYTIYFGDNVIGKQPQDGSIIVCNYLNVVGAAANNISKFYVSDKIGGLYRNNVSITSANTTYGGTDKETITQIRFRAPNFYTTQNRAVTIDDYKTLVLKDYNNIDAVSVWSGEDNDPVVYGKVFLSLKTKNNYALTEADKNVIINDLITKRSVLTVVPEIVDPDYSYILVKGTVKYDPRLTSRSANELLNFVKAAISDYSNQELNQFSSTLKKSRLQYYIENSEPSITSSDLTLYLQKRVPLFTGLTTSYTANFSTSLQKGDYNNRLFTTPEVQTFDPNGISRNIYFEEVPSAATGIDSITLVSSGINYSTIPTVTIVGDGTGATAKAITNGSQIIAIELLSSGSNYTKALVEITGSQGSGAVAMPILQTTTGKLRSYYLSPTGQKIILNSSAGTINYQTGKVIITNLFTQLGTPQNRYYNTDVVAIGAPLETEVVTSSRNQIFTIDQNDPVALQVNVVAE